MAGTRGGGSDLNFEAELFEAADKLRGNWEPSEYRHVVPGLIFLKIIFDDLAVRTRCILGKAVAIMLLS
jgi:type I restriction enzyme M protein